jgi:beta-galactosidase/beta-glucuronidase
MSASIPRPEYPRPQLQRERWQCLNGTWDFAFDDAGSLGADQVLAMPALDGTIVVPFAYQSSLSGIGERVVHPVVWYRRHFAVPADWGGRALLHFGAVDYHAEFWLNGRRLGDHTGGYTPVMFEIEPAAGENTLVVRCEDLPSDEQPFGKQDREGHLPYRFAATTGIWQTVWLEPAGECRFAGCRIEPQLAAPGFRLSPRVTGAAAGEAGLRVRVRVLFAGREVGGAEMAADAVRELVRVRESHPWSDDKPDLYDLDLELVRGGRTVDRARSYAGLREITIEGRSILLNGRPLYQRQVLDQGYWPDGVYTAATDEALRADVEWTRRLGFNGSRKHQKIEDPRWLYWCDRLGLLVWHEMPAFGVDTPLSRQRLRREWSEAVARDLNHPSIVAWVPFNESMGIRDVAANPGTQEFVAAVVADTRALDTTRPVVDNSGWEHVDTDIADSHNYDPAGVVFLDSWRRFHAGSGPEKGTSVRSWNGSYAGREWYGPQYPRRLFVPGREYAGQPITISEWGGFFLRGRGEVALILEKRRGVEKDETAFLVRYEDMVQAFDSLPDLAGDCWTQLTDIDDEPNGLLTEDRKPKIDTERIAAANLRRYAAARRT